MYVRFAYLLACSWAFWGCGEDGSASGATEVSTAADGEPRAVVDAELSLFTGGSLRLGVDEEAPLEVSYTQLDGSPIAAGVVSFALMGRAGDASLSELDVTTDDAGMAQNTLIAGQASSYFQLRVSAEGAEPLFIDVAISDGGFGRLTVTAEYDGRRLVEQRTVVAQADVSCDAAERQPGDPMLTLSDAGPATFEALPAGRSYAVTAMAEGPESLVVAVGCVDGVQVVSDADVKVTIDFEDAALIPDGQFPLVLTLDSSAPAMLLHDTIAEAVVERIESDGSGSPAPANAEARLLLDSLDATLRSAEYDGVAGALQAADDLASERLTPSQGTTPDEDLQGKLDTARKGARTALALLLDGALASLSQVSLELTATNTLDGDTVHSSWSLQRLRAAGLRAKADPLEVDLSGVAPVMSQAAFDGDADSLSPQGLRLELGWGSMATQVLGAAVSEEVGLLDSLQTAMGCESLQQWVQGSSLVSTACDLDCSQRACDRALNAMTSAAEMELALLDSTRPRTALELQLVLQDEDGDLQADSMEQGQVTGTWLDAEDKAGSEMLAGSFSNAPEQP